jgi:hypothetical protein
MALQTTAFTIGESKGIREGLLDQPPHQPCPVEGVSRSFHLNGTAVKIQGTADANQPIQQWRIQTLPIQQGIEQHGAPQRESHRSKGQLPSGWSQVKGQSATSTKHREEIPGAVGRIRALGQVPPWPRTAEVQPEHPKAQATQSLPKPALAPIITASPQSMDHQHQPKGGDPNPWEIQPGQEAIPCWQRKLQALARFRFGLGWPQGVA